jgi:hypothetical protein
MNQVDAALAHEQNIADLTLALGDVDAAIAMLRDVSARLAPRRDQLFHMFALIALATALLLKGDAAAARVPFAAAVPLIMRYDLAHRYGDSAALLAALEGRLETAARALGYADAARLAQGNTRDVHQVTARERVLRLLANVDADTLARWKREGAQLRESEVYAEALASRPRD